MKIKQAFLDDYRVESKVSLQNKSKNLIGERGRALVSAKAIEIFFLADNRHRPSLFEE